MEEEEEEDNTLSLNVPRGKGNQEIYSSHLIFTEDGERAVCDPHWLSWAAIHHQRVDDKDQVQLFMAGVGPGLEIQFIGESFGVTIKILRTFRITQESIAKCALKGIKINPACTETMKRPIWTWVHNFEFEVDPQSWDKEVTFDFIVLVANKKVETSCRKIL